MFTVGAGFSSIDNLVGFVDISQGNFDLFNPPTFTGGGQKARLHLALGTQRRDVILSFIEPWFLDRKLALGVDFYSRLLEFQSLNSLYNEERLGARLSLTRALWSDFVIGSLSYTVEDVGIVNLSSLAPPSLTSEAGHSLLSRVGASLAYDTRNHALMPSQGQRTELMSELVGGPFGGDKNFYKLELRSTWYFPGFFSGHVLEVVGLTGVAQGFSGTETVPFYERYYLGGQNTLRGYKYRDIGPKETLSTGEREPVGGNTYWFGSAEYSIPVIERLRFAVFYDIGSVYRGSYSYNFGNYTDNWGVGVRLNLPIGPLRLDYGIPISHDRFTSGSGRFQFGVGFHRDY
jgi:outer membrane protein insertion porin family